MIAVDTNLLVYAHRTDSPFNVAAQGAMSRLAAGMARWVGLGVIAHALHGIAQPLTA